MLYEYSSHPHRAPVMEAVCTSETLVYLSKTLAAISQKAVISLIAAVRT
jgi:hypothetical protein